MMNRIDGKPYAEIVDIAAMGFPKGWQEETLWR